MLSNLKGTLYKIFHKLPPINESGVTRELIRQCVNKPDPTILEIGANDGSHTLWFLELFENPTIYCFEPDPRVIKRFKAQVGDRPNVTLVEIALSDREGEITFYQSDGQQDDKTEKLFPDGFDQSGSIKKPKEHLKIHPWIKFEKSIRVRTATLDSWCAQNGIDVIDFIWMDVQGAEIEVFNGGGKAIGNTRYLYTEYSNKELFKGQPDLVTLLNFLSGFSLVERYSDDVFLKNERYL